ncbi:MAG: D-glycero-beta-D-manno-heptose 1-phosphate adenylyltransferase [Acidobacteriota bacterium]|nr:MAG: D-glycero-beta-D-manno-heptose 1-phosphate adenylyltransferase [Acidobacteriota bacterium]
MIVFTNGCFDIIHPGHIDLLERAKALGDRLIVGLNSDRSVRSIKGPDRPIQNQVDRAAVLSGLRSVDEVIIFDEATPEELIRKIKPDVLVKGGDWPVTEIVGADLVQSWGGKVVSLPLLPGYSSSAIIDRMTEDRPARNGRGSDEGSDSLKEHISVMDQLDAECRDSIAKCFGILSDTLMKGQKVLVCGNGGSAADAQHIAAELVGRFERERRAYPAIALTTDTSALTALANDYDFERVFARQVEALAAAGDCLIAISTSGNSPNVIAAVMEARRKGARVIGMTGSGGKKLASLCDACLMVPSLRTARIQEAHITVAHFWCEMLDSADASVAA